MDHVETPVARDEVPEVPLRDPLAAIRSALAGAEADAALLTFLPDIRWATGFTGSNGLLIVTPMTAHFVSDGRYATQARQQVQNAVVYIPPDYKLLEYAQANGLLAGCQRLLLQGEHVTVETYGQIAALFPDVTLAPASGWLVEAVAAKTPDEIRKIKAAQEITDAVFADLLGLIVPGLTEKALAAEIVYRHLKAGAERMSFDPIVASGPNGALPHGRPTARPLERGDLVVIDMGGVLDGYASDMTRTVAVGEPGERAREVYAHVLAAQEAALAVARSGVLGGEIDKAARDVLIAAGLGEAFSHGLGHGIGLQTHEWPRLSQQVEHRLPAGAVVSIEPGVYLPGAFGVRIEDLVALQPDGCENLTSSPKHLLVL